SGIISSSNADLLANLSTITATGGLTLQNGRHLTLPGDLSNAGTIVIGSASTLTVGGNVQIQGGVLAGSGTLFGTVLNAGLVQPGDTASAAADGVLTIQGDYTQTAGGALNVQVEGKSAGTQFDQLNVSGTVSLDGALHVLRPSSFVPNA